MAGTASADNARRGDEENGPIPELIMVRHKYNRETAAVHWGNINHWRQKYDVDNMPTRPKAYFTIIRNAYPQFFYTRSKIGQCVVQYERLGGMRFKDGYDKGLRVEHLVEYFFFRLEFFMQYSKRMGISSQRVIVMDLAGLKLSQFTRPVRTYLREANRVANTYFPNQVDKLFVIHAPKVFNTAWKVIKRFVNAHTLSKIRGTSELIEYVGEKAVPADYGGKGNVAIEEDEVEAEWIALLNSAPPLDAPAGTCHNVPWDEYREWADETNDDEDGDGDEAVEEEEADVGKENWKEDSEGHMRDDDDDDRSIASGTAQSEADQEHGEANLQPRTHIRTTINPPNRPAPATPMPTGMPPQRTTPEPTTPASTLRSSASDLSTFRRSSSGRPIVG